MTLDLSFVRYPLGRYEIIARPLHQNPAFRTHHIYLGTRCIGRQLSVPTESDCDWHALQVKIVRDEPIRITLGIHHHRKAGPGRPRGKALTIKARY